MFFRMLPTLSLILISPSDSIYYTICLHRVFVLVFNLRVVALRKGACIRVNQEYIRTVCYVHTGMLLYFSVGSTA